MRGVFVEGRLWLCNQHKYLICHNSIRFILITNIYLPDCNSLIVLFNEVIGYEQFLNLLGTSCHNLIPREMKAFFTQLCSFLWYKGIAFS